MGRNLRPYRGGQLLQVMVPAVSIMSSIMIHFARDIPDNAHDFRNVLGTRTALVDNGTGDLRKVGQFTGPYLPHRGRRTTTTSSPKRPFLRNSQPRVAPPPVVHWDIEESFAHAKSKVGTRFAPAMVIMLATNLAVISVHATESPLLTRIAGNKA